MVEVMPEDEKQDDNKEPKDNATLGTVRQAETVLQLVLALPAGCFVGLAVGYFLDRHFHTKWLAITLMLLGGIGGFIQIFRYLSSSKGGEQ
jgi:F0F1-type ATP synthase assembly protein I